MGIPVKIKAKAEQPNNSKLRERGGREGERMFTAAY